MARWPGNKSKMDFPCAERVAAGSLRAANESICRFIRGWLLPGSHLPTVSRHESCSAPSVIRPYVLKAARCTCVRPCTRAVAWLCVCVCVCDCTPAYVSPYVCMCARHRGTNLSVPPTHPANFFFYRLSARCLSGPLILHPPPCPALRLPEAVLDPVPLLLLPQLGKDEKGRRKSRRQRHFLDEIRMYVPPYPDLVRGIHRGGGASRPRTAARRPLDL